MGSNKWEEFGGGMNDLVQKAIDSGNYNSLGRDINDIARKFAYSFEDAINKGFNEAKKSGVKINLGGNTVEVDKFYEDRIRRPAEVKRNELAEDRRLYISDNQILSKGIGATIGGGMLTFGTGIGLIATLPVGEMVASVTMLIIFGLSSFLLGSGIKTLKDRLIFKNYRKVLNISDSKSYATLEDLMHETGESRKKTLKRLREMIRKRWFKEGHLDKNETTLISTNETYALYQKTQADYEQRQRIEAELGVSTGEKAQSAETGAEVKEVLETGNRYLAQISHLNDIIPGLEVSKKIFKIEELTGRILKRVEEHPSSVEDIKQLMKYYLPMTIKLLTAYAEMDKQQVQGDNIDKSKREIENVLDSLHEAFEKLLNDLYKDTAWDVSSDVSVLNAMLKREGLRGSDFEGVESTYKAEPVQDTETSKKEEGIKLEI